jgi:hypothetical protein
VRDQPGRIDPAGGEEAEGLRVMTGREDGRPDDPQRTVVDEVRVEARARLLRRKAAEQQDLMP